MFSAVKLTSKDHEPTFTPSAFPRPPDSVPNPDAAASSTAIPRNRPRPLPCQFPPRPVAEQLLEIYFQQANPQFPILFRPTFINIFHRLCDRVETEGSASPENYAHGNGGLTPDRVQHSADLYFAFMCFAIASAMSQSSENMPERYHASAMQHLDALFMSVSFSNNRLDGLKGVLLLAVYSMMRPGIPGVWYVVGAALRLAVDLGLHNESAQKADKHWDPVQLDERRRLFWCTYSVDRQVSVYLGRPFGIADDAIKVPFPLDVDDDLITPSGIRHPAPGTRSSRTISLHMFRIRQLQSEIQQVLYQTSSVPRQFPTLDIWLHDMSARLTHWHTTAPKTPASAGCTFNLSFLDLNYEQTRLLLHGLCPAIPHPSTESFHIIADSGSKIIKSYRHLHREKSINYTWLACHNLFMAGTSYLCALWQSLDVRAATTIDEIDFHTLACIDVLSSMVERCPAAQTCRDVFESLAANTVHLCSNEYAALRPDPRPVKRFKAETEWCPPASIANLLHHPQSYEMAYPDQVDVMAGMDGSRLFEMIQEVGSGGNAGYGIGGYDGVWGLDAWVGAQGALMGGF